MGVSSPSPRAHTHGGRSQLPFRVRPFHRVLPLGTLIDCRIVFPLASNGTLECVQGCKVQDHLHHSDPTKYCSMLRSRSVTSLHLRGASFQHHETQDRFKHPRDTHRSRSYYRSGPVYSQRRQNILLYQAQPLRTQRPAIVPFFDEISVTPEVDCWEKTRIRMAGHHTSTPIGGRLAQQWMACLRDNGRMKLQMQPMHFSLPTVIYRRRRRVGLIEGR